jgi:hypothetical protein
MKDFTEKFNQQSLRDIATSICGEGREIIYSMVLQQPFSVVAKVT